MTSTDQQDQPHSSIQVVEEVARVKAVTTTELSPLYDTIDSDALDTLLQSDTDRDEGECRIQFQYEGCTVAIDRDSGIQVTEDGR